MNFPDFTWMGVVVIDRLGMFCQAADMSRLSRQFVAVLLAIWLPLFSGNALAVSVVMQADCCDGHASSVQPVETHSHHASEHRHMQHNRLAMQQDQAAGHCDQQNDHHDHQSSSCKSCGVCHLACCGYLAAVAIELAAVQPLALSFTSYSLQFQSVISTPLDPPPLARV
jgi:hypothetical protein